MLQARYNQKSFEMGIDDRYCLKVHGYVFSSSSDTESEESTDGSGSDDKYSHLEPPPVPVSKDRVIKISRDRKISAKPLLTGAIPRNVTQTAKRRNRQRKKNNGVTSSPAAKKTLAGNSSGSVKTYSSNKNNCVVNTYKNSSSSGNNRWTPKRPEPQTFYPNFRSSTVQQRESPIFYPSFHNNIVPRANHKTNYNANTKPFKEVQALHNNSIQKQTKNDTFVSPLVLPQKPLRPVSLPRGKQDVFNVENEKAAHANTKTARNPSPHRQNHTKSSMSYAEISRINNKRTSNGQSSVSKTVSPNVVSEEPNFSDWAKQTCRNQQESHEKYYVKTEEKPTVVTTTNSPCVMNSTAGQSMDISTASRLNANNDFTALSRETDKEEVYTENDARLKQPQRNNNPVNALQNSVCSNQGDYVDTAIRVELPIDDTDHRSEQHLLTNNESGFFNCLRVVFSWCFCCN